MDLNDTQCCAIREIDGLSDHFNAEEAMLSFCETFSEGVYNNQTGTYNSNAKLGTLPGLITFSAVVGLTTDKKGPSTAYTYGQHFKAYILRHRLGSVVESPLTINRQNHPTHKIRAYMWRPNQKRLQAWWATHRAEEED